MDDAESTAPMSDEERALFAEFRTAANAVKTKEAEYKSAQIAFADVMKRMADVAVKEPQK